MDLVGLAELLKMLPEGSLWELSVHPSQLQRARSEIIKANLVGQVLITGNPAIGPDDFGVAAPPPRWWQRFARSA